MPRPKSTLTPEEQRLKAKAYKAQWYRENLEAVKAKSVAQRKNNPEWVKEYRKKYKLLNPKKDAERMRKWREKNPGSLTAWRIANREKVRQHNAKRKARKRGVEIGNLKKIAEWEKLWKSKRSVICFWCKGKFSPRKCHTDHIVPLSKNGKHELDNLAIACADCNQKKHAKMPEQFVKELQQPLLFF